jgi:hypothetical protein
MEARFVLSITDLDNHRGRQLQFLYREVDIWRSEVRQSYAVVTRVELSSAWHGQTLASAAARFFFLRDVIINLTKGHSSVSGRIMVGAWAIVIGAR